MTLADEDYCYLTTTGRATGKPHEIEIWFAVEGASLYFLAGGRDTSDWVKNARKTPSVTIRIADRRVGGTARVVVDPGEDALARRLLLEKYAPPRYAGDLSDWGKNALPVAVDLRTKLAG